MWPICLRRIRAQAMGFYPVSTRVNAVRNDDAALIEEVAMTAPPASDDPAPPDAQEEEHLPEQASLF